VIARYFIVPRNYVDTHPGIIVNRRALVSNLSHGLLNSRTSMSQCSHIVV